MKSPSPTTESSRAPLRIETDENSTHRLFRGKEYLGVPSLREVELFNSHSALLSACEAVLGSDMVAASSPRHPAVLKLRAAIAAARKERK